jgi:hypothetical protein
VDSFATPVSHRNPLDRVSGGTSCSRVTRWMRRSAPPHSTARARSLLRDRKRCRLFAESWRIAGWGGAIFLVGLVVCLAPARVPGYVVMTIGGVIVGWYGPCGRQQR